MFKAALALGLLTAVALVAVVFASAGDSADPASAGNGGMEAMSIDADPTGNTATSLGDRDECVEAEAGSDVMVDVTALNIPADNPLFGFAFSFTYDANNLSVTAVDYSQLIVALPDSSAPTDAGDVIPDTDGAFVGGALDLTATPESSESGSGVLARVTISIDASAPAGGYPLLFGGEDNAHLNPESESFVPNSFNSAQIAVGVTCESLGPLPTPTPAPEFAFGDIDCDGDVDAVDALQILRHVAGLGANQQPGCPAMGQNVAGHPWGDIDCDGDVDAVDALQVLRHVAGLGANQTQPCPALG